MVEQIINAYHKLVRFQLGIRRITQLVKGGVSKTLAEATAGSIPVFANKILKKNCS